MYLRSAACYACVSCATSYFFYLSTVHNEPIRKQQKIVWKKMKKKKNEFRTKRESNEGIIYRTHCRCALLIPCVNQQSALPSSLASSTVHLRQFGNCALLCENFRMPRYLSAAIIWTIYLQIAPIVADIQQHSKSDHQCLPWALGTHTNHHIWHPSGLRVQDPTHTHATSTRKTHEQ